MNTTASVDQEITLTDDQQKAMDAFVTFLFDPIERVFVLEGYSGTGKSTLVRTLIDRLPGFIKLTKLVNPEYEPLEVCLTATTNKAAEALSNITGEGVRTIHSHLGLRVSTDYSTGVTHLIPRANTQVYDQLLFIDEASYIDSQLLKLIFSQTVRCKIVFMGDRAQLSPVKSTNTPVFMAGFNGAMLEKVVRQAENNPIVAMSTAFRNTVNTGVWTPIKPDGIHIIHLSRDAFEDEVLKEFTRDDWRFSDSKILGWTNKCVLKYNHAISGHIKGDPKFIEGDYAVNNSFVTSGKMNLKTDETVHITCIESDEEQLGVLGNYITLNHSNRFFFPKSLAAKKERLKKAKAIEDYHTVQHINDSWIDLRAAYAQTINKSQGSTYDRVYIDLDDLRGCNSGDQIARMMYVGPSRARHQVFMTGDFA